jgi:CubicO group peptidase (beta-lactamase class C family)
MDASLASLPKGRPLPQTFHVPDADRRSILGLGLTGLAASLGWNAAAQTATASPGIDDLLDLSASAYGTVGHSVAVLRRGRLVYSRHAGLSDRETGTPITDRSVYPLFSISKLFLIVELLKAHSAGLIDFNEPLGAIRAGLPPAWTGITLAQTLAHVSGLPDYIPDHVAPTEDAAFVAIAALPLRFGPGARNDYNQTNFLFARNALEQATRTPLTALVGQQFRSVGMPHTGYHIAGQPELPDLVSSYRPAPGRDRPPLPYISPSWPAYTFGSRGVFTTLPDLVRWSQALLSGKLVSLAALRDSWVPFAMPSGNAAWHTHGWEYYRHDDVTIVGHGGEVRLVWRHFFREGAPDDSATVIYLDNGGRTTFDRHRLATLLADHVMPGAARKGEAQEEALYRGLAAGRWDQAVAAIMATMPADQLEATVNRVGYDAMNILDAEAALPAFQWNVERFPRSSNAHDSLGDAYRAAGQIDRAKDSYRRTLALDPANERLKATINDGCVQNRRLCHIPPRAKKG